MCIDVFGRRFLPRVVSRLSYSQYIFAFVFYISRRVILGHTLRRGSYMITTQKYPFVYDRQDLTLLEMTPSHDIKHVIPLAKIRLISKQVKRA